MVEAIPSQKKTFFLNSLGPTLETLAYFSSTRVKRLLSTLSKRSQQFLLKNKQHIFQLCLPTMFDSKMIELDPITKFKEIPILKVMHLRDSLFIVAYINALIELRDFTSSSEEALMSY